MAHWAAKIGAPSLAVPFPGGSSFPSGPTMLFPRRNSSSVGGLPTLYVGDWATAVPHTSRANTGSKKLDFETILPRILDAPFLPHCLYPALKITNIPDRCL